MLLWHRLRLRELRLVKEIQIFVNEADKHIPMAAALCWESPNAELAEVSISDILTPQA
jgi:hypothetical protein